VAIASPRRPRSSRRRPRKRLERQRMCVFVTSNVYRSLSYSVQQGVFLMRRPSPWLFPFRSSPSAHRS
jgi:hypothetical protein